MCRQAYMVLKKKNTEKALQKRDWDKTERWFWEKEKIEPDSMSIKTHGYKMKISIIIASMESEIISPCLS